MAMNTSDSTTSSTNKREIGFLQACGLCFKLPVVTAAKTAAATLIIADAAASALDETRLKKTGKGLVNEVNNFVDMGILATHRMNLEIAYNLDVTLGGDLDQQIEEMDKSFYEKKAKEENK